MFLRRQRPDGTASCCRQASTRHTSAHAVAENARRDTESPVRAVCGKVTRRQLPTSPRAWTSLPAPSGGSRPWIKRLFVQARDHDWSLASLTRPGTFAAALRVVCAGGLRARCIDPRPPLSLVVQRGSAGLQTSLRSWALLHGVSCARQRPEAGLCVSSRPAGRRQPWVTRLLKRRAPRRQGARRWSRGKAPPHIAPAHWALLSSCCPPCFPSAHLAAVTAVFTLVLRPHAPCTPAPPGASQQYASAHPRT